MPNLETITEIASNASWDVVLLLGFVIAGFFYGLWSGRARLIAVLFSLYVSKLLFENFRFIDLLTQGREALEIFLIRIAVFGVAVIVLAFLFARILPAPKSFVRERWWQIFLLSFLEIGLFISIAFQLLPNDTLFTFSPLVNYLFASPDAFFWWLFLPLPALFFTIQRQ